jgi:hypothetical protein
MLTFWTCAPSRTDPALEAHDRHMTSIRKRRWLVAGGTFLTTMLLGIAPASAATVPSLSQLLKAPPCL